MSDQVLSVVAPLHDDAPWLESFVDEVLVRLRPRSELFELILVDDGSADETPSIAARLARERPGVRLIRLSRKFGPDMAILAGLESSIGDFVVVLRADSDPPEEILRITELARQGADVVQGLAANSSRDGWIFRLARAAFVAGSRRFLGLEVPPPASSLCGFTRRAVNAITRLKQRQRHLSLLSCCVGFPRRTLRYQKAYRSRPRHQPLLAAIDVGISVVVTNSRSPLRFVSYLGCCAGAINLLYVIYILAVNVFKRHVMEGWTTLSLQNSLMFFFVFVIQVLMAEYVGWILEEAKAQPLYHVLDEAGGYSGAGTLMRNVVGHSPVDGGADAHQHAA